MRSIHSAHFEARTAKRDRPILDAITRGGIYLLALAIFWIATSARAQHSPAGASPVGLGLPVQSGGHPKPDRRVERDAPDAPDGAEASDGALEPGPSLESDASLAGSPLDGEADRLWAQARSLLGDPMTLEQATAGALLFSTDVEGVYLPAPPLNQEITVEVHGLIARTRVEQRFTNPTDAWLEGIYVFPLPERSAVDELRMLIGTREIIGVIQEREQAKKTYEDAKASGRKASLVEQERPNLFTNSVANIGPGEEIVIAIEYQEDLRYDDGRIALRLPLVVAPRFNPGRHVVRGFTGSGWGLNTDQVPDAERITPPVILTPADLARDQTVDPRFPHDEIEQSDGDRTLGPGYDVEHFDGDPINPVTITVSIDRDLELEMVRSPSHRIEVTRSARAYVVELEDGSISRDRTASAGRAASADRDFVLEWWPARRDAPQAALYTQEFANAGGQETFAHLMIMPPHQVSDRANARTEVPRELTLIIDTSGSMGGTSIEQAKAALLLALDRLGPSDAFDVIEFNSGARSLFGRPIEALPARVEEARRFVRRLCATGGTNIAEALELALAKNYTAIRSETTIDMRQGGPAQVRQIVFATDGSVGNEEELFALIADRLDDRRLFTVGIGSAPNNHFMRRAAQFGRGTFTNISDLSEVEVQMGRLFTKLESPALVDLELVWQGFSPEEIATIETWPMELPDLYAGEPLVLSARLPSLSRGRGMLVVKGWRGDEPWQTSLPIEPSGDAEGIDRLWARHKIAALMDQITMGGDPEGLRTQVTALGIEHHLVTSFTSLVAVDTEPSRPEGELMASRPIPVQLPAGWSAESTFGVTGPLPAGGTSSRLLICTGILLLGLGLAARRRSLHTPAAPRSQR